jgi:hypothetical protein
MATTPIKPGVKTTEFWITIATVAGSLASIVQPFGELHPYANAAGLLAAGISSAAYAVSRGKAKQ